jgi:hypothetical protein
MKGVYTILLSLFLLSSVTSYAQQTENYDNAITANPLGLAFGLLNAQYEFQLGSANSVLIRGNYWTPGGLFSGWSAYGFGGSYRWYMDAFKQGTTPISGFSFGPAVSVDFWSWDDEDVFGIDTDYDGGATFRIGAEANYKWVWGGFALEPGINLMFAIADIEGLGTISPFGILFNIGYAW